MPAAAEIKARGLGWYELPVTEADTTMYQAWLNYDNAGTPTPATATPASTPTPRTVLGAYSIHSIVVSPTPTKGSTGAPTADHPAVTTAAEELEMIFPRAVVIAGAPPMTGKMTPTHCIGSCRVPRTAAVHSLFSVFSSAHTAVPD